MVAATTPTEALSFSYDVDGIRWKKTASGVATHFVVDKNRDFAQVLEERDTAGAIDVLYVYGDDLISQERAATGLRFYHVDGQMSTRQLTDSGANPTDSYTFDAFGVTLSQTGLTPNNYLYAGEQLDVQSGFYYLRARYLNQAAGRFASHDPFAGIDKDPWTLHKYLYTGADPVNNRDPSGLLTLLQQIAAIIIIAILVGTFGPAHTKQRVRVVITMNDPDGIFTQRARDLALSIFRACLREHGRENSATWEFVTGPRPSEIGPTRDGRVMIYLSSGGTPVGSEWGFSSAGSYQAAIYKAHIEPDVLEYNGDMDIAVANAIGHELGLHGVGGSYDYWISGGETTQTMDLSRASAEVPWVRQTGFMPPRMCRDFVFGLFRW